MTKKQANELLESYAVDNYDTEAAARLQKIDGDSTIVRREPIDSYTGVLLWREGDTAYTATQDDIDSIIWPDPWDVNHSATGWKD